MDATSVRRRWPARCIAVVRAVPMVLAITLAVVHFTPLIPWVVRRMAVWDEQPTRGVLVVLGAEQQTDGTLGLMSYWRCFYAAEAWRHGQFSRILVSGRGSAPADAALTGQPVPPTLAESMRVFLIAAGVPAAAILTEVASVDTHQNAVYSVALLKQMTGPFTVLTSDFHSWRAQRCFRRAGLTVSSWPAPDVIKRYASGWSYRLASAALVAEEWTKLAYYYWKGWI